MNTKPDKKYIFIVGGVMSSVGKGITTASVAKLLKDNGYKTTCVKADPYVNVDAGTMNPVEHGEVFVTDDGDECDLDIGNYERFLESNISSVNYMTTGRVYQSVINRERNLEYDGACVEVIPHIPEEMITRIRTAADVNEAEITIIEIGGTVGEYQNQLFLEAARMMRLHSPGNVIFAMVSYLPIPEKAGEMKTKPTQSAVRTLNTCGIQADILFCRSSTSIDQKRKEKLSLFCNMPPSQIFSAPDVESIYDVPISFAKQRVHEKIVELLSLPQRNNDDHIEEWARFVEKTKHQGDEINIGVIGKYFESGSYVLGDVYISVLESIKHAGWYIGQSVNIRYIESYRFEGDNTDLEILDELDGIVIPGGFGSRGAEGIINSVCYAREHDIPILGICYGMQLMCIEYARNICGIRGATSEEIDPKAKNKVIHVIPHQRQNIAEQRYGGSMRLGEYLCRVRSGTRTREIYNKEKINERHRHRFEFNLAFKDQLVKDGMVFAGAFQQDAPLEDLEEIIELPEHPFFIGVQFHPEFLSRPLNPHPLFRELLRAALNRNQSRKLF